MAAVGAAYVLRAIPEIVLGVALIAGCFFLYFVWAALGLADTCQPRTAAISWQDQKADTRAITPRAVRLALD